MSGKRFVDKFLPCWLLLTAAIILTNCVSRYRLDLFLDIDNHQRKAKVEKTEYVINTRLANPYAEDKLVNGSNAVIILTTGATGLKSQRSIASLFGFDEYLNCRLYLQFARPPSPSKIELVGNSMVHLLGRYDLSREAKIFLPESGAWVIDSVTTKHLYGSIDGQFENSDGAKVGYNGRFKVKIK